MEIRQKRKLSDTSIVELLKRIGLRQVVNNAHVQVRDSISIVSS